MENACHGCAAGQGLHASALRRSYIPMRSGHCPVSFPLARSRLMAAFLLSHPCGGCMAYLMERECRIHKDKEPQGSSPYAAVAGATIPVALGKADRHQRAFMEHACHEPVKTCCKSELARFRVAAFLLFPPLRRVYGTSDGEGVQDS